MRPIGRASRKNINDATRLDNFPLRIGMAWDSLVL
jgi:hypothetical protein